MAYLGNAPARSFISFERQVFTIVNSQTAYTLDHSVNNENDIRLVINNIVQEPGSGKAYTASGTTLTLSAALTNGTDEMYCVFLGRATATNAPGAGSVNTAAIAADAVTTAKITDLNVTTAKIAADAITEAKIADDAVESEHLNDNVISGQTELASAPASTDELLISDAGTLKRIDVSLVGGTNTPTFLARKSGDQAGISANTFTKVTGWAEIFDPQSTWDNSNSKWSPASAGKYLIFGTVYVYSNNGTRTFVSIYKNGAQLNTVATASGSNDNFPLIVTAMDDNDGDDYYELYVKTAASGTVVYSSGVTNQFGGFKIIE
jgi:hypothetical protein